MFNYKKPTIGIKPHGMNKVKLCYVEKFKYACNNHFTTPASSEIYLNEYLQSYELSFCWDKIPEV